VAEVVDQVGEQRHRAREREDRELDPGGDPEHGEADRDRLHALARADDRAIDEPVRVTVPAVAMVVPAVAVVVAMRDVLGDRLHAHWPTSGWTLIGQPLAG